MKIKRKPVLQLPSQGWVQNLALAVDITDHLNNMNRMLQGCNKDVTQYYDNMQAFKSKLSLWEMQLSNNNPAHPPCLKHLWDACADDLGQQKENVSSLL